MPWATAEEVDAMRDGYTVLISTQANNYGELSTEIAVLTNEVKNLSEDLKELKQMLREHQRLHHPQ